MNEKILIAYASRAGSTAEIANTIGIELRKNGFTVDVRSIKENPRVEDYQMVIIGSAVRFGQWLPETMKYLQVNQAALKARSTAFFAVYLMNMGDDAASLKLRQTYLEPARQLVTPRAEAYFTGVGDPAKVALFERLIAKAVKSPEGDFRNWAAIRQWAQELARQTFAGALVS